MEKRRSRILPSYRYSVAVSVSKMEELGVQNILLFIEVLRLAIGMEKMAEPTVGVLESDICGIDAHSVYQPILQPLTTSFIMIDTWPEETAFVLDLHSCKKFEKEEVIKAVCSFFPNSKRCGEKFEDEPYRLDDG